MTELQILRALAVAGYQAYSMSLVGNPAPSVRRYYERVTEPRPGDLVLEITTFGRDPWAAAGLGELLEVTEEPIMSEDEHHAMIREGNYFKHPDEKYDAVPIERVQYIEPLDPDLPRRFRWVNAEFIALPSDKIRRELRG